MSKKAKMRENKEKRAKTLIHFRLPSGGRCWVNLSAWLCLLPVCAMTSIIGAPTIHFRSSKLGREK